MGHSLISSKRSVVMKYRFLITLSVIVVMLVAVSAFGIGRASASTGCFNDTNGNWAEPFICWMKDNGISSGTGGGNYSPNTNVTRAQMAVFMARQAEFHPAREIFTSIQDQVGGLKNMSPWQKCVIVQATRNSIQVNPPIHISCSRPASQAACMAGKFSQRE